MALTLRLVKGSELTYQELDDNFTYLSSSIASGGGPVDISGYVTTSSFNAYTGSNTSQFAGTASFATTASFASNAASASYVNLLQGPNIQINYTAAGIEVSGTISGISGVGGLTLATGSGANQIRLLSASVLVGDEIIVPFATSASFLTTDITRIATGSVTASVTPSQFSVVSGSTTEFVITGTGMTLGSALTDIHNITGSVRITGSLDIRNSLTVTGSTLLRNTGSDSAGTGSNLVPNSTGWTGINWTGDNATGFYRTTPDANRISCSAVPPLVVGETYIATLISTGLTLPQTNVAIAVGDAGTILTVFSQNIITQTSFRATTTNATMSIIPGVSVFGPWDGTASVALYRVTSSNSTVTILPTAGTTGVEFRPSPGNTSTNLAIGTQAGQKLVSANPGALISTGNTYIGQEAGASDGSGYSQAFLGYRAGLVNTGYNNTFLGAYAGDRNTLGNNNTFIGTAAGGSNNASQLSSGSSNVGIGVSALRVNNTPTNVAVGNSTLTALTTGIGGNIAVGHNAGVAISSGSYNTVVGFGAGARIIGGSQNICLGFSAGGIGAGGNNTYVGNSPGIFHNGNNAIFIGNAAGYFNQSSAGGIYIGRLAGYRDVSGSNNIIIGNSAGEQMQITAQSASVVTQSTVAQTNNVIIGEQAAQYMWAGSSNTVLGTNAARKYNTSTGGAVPAYPTGSNLNNSIYIGYLAGSPTLGAATDSQLSGSNEIVIGANQVGFGSNTTAIGTNSTSASYLYGDLIVTGTLGDVMVLPFENPLPSAKRTGSVALSGSGGTFEGMYVYNGTTWTKIGP